MRPVSRKTSVVRPAGDGEGRLGLVEVAGYVRLGPSLLVRARQSAVVTVKTAVRIIRVEEKMVREVPVKTKFQSVILTLWLEGEESERVCLLFIQSFARIADDVIFAALRIRKSRIFNCMQDVFPRVTRGENVISGDLALKRYSEFSLLKRLDVGIDTTDLRQRPAADGG